MVQKRWSQEDIKQLEHLVIKTEMTYNQIAKKMGRSYDSIKHAIRRYGFVHVDEESDLFFGSSSPKKLTYEQLNELGKCIGDKIYQNYKVVKLPEYKPRYNKKTKKEETSVLDISDVHLGMKNEIFDSESGKRVVTYNMEIFQKEMIVLQDSIFQIHEILSNSYQLKDLVIFILGDILTNDRIFKEQVFEIEKIVGLQIWDGVNYFTRFFNNLLRIYETITIVCVVGNHGRSLPDSYEEPVENNFEYNLYRIWQKQFEYNDRINIVVPESRRIIYPVYNWKHLLEHGDSMRGTSDNYIEKQIKELSLNMGGFDMMHYGHFHKLKEREIADKVIVKQNGSWIEKDGYGFRKFKTYSIPKQFFFGCNAKRVETWGYKLDLRG